eukprot:5786548-Heterocapsa_arctica.AAC.1
MVTRTSSHSMTSAELTSTAWLRVGWVELPDEEKIGDKEPMVGLLKKTMYGTVDASARWQSDYASLLKGA